APIALPELRGVGVDLRAVDSCAASWRGSERFHGGRVMPGSNGGIMIHGLGLVFALLQSLSYLNRDYRILCGKFVANSAIASILTLAVLGYIMGTSFACLLAPRRFIEASRS